MATKRKKKAKQKTNKKKTGGRVLMPIQYFDSGAKVPKYYPAGSKELQHTSSAFGDVQANSFGKYVPQLTCGKNPSTAPNLAASPNSSTLQTGGKKN